ncbi:MAG: hypothetical protein P4M11_02910 [Candidatus Pacebacteria bacterium]|nr:hypothetical protein [Candidatus Paceibacterota bacterium]
MSKPCHKPSISKLQLSSTPSTPSLLSMSEHKTGASTGRPYPLSPFKLSSKQYDKWMSRQFHEDIVCDDSVHDVMGDEEPEKKQEEGESTRRVHQSLPPSPQPYQQQQQQIRAGAESIRDFYTKYKEINKSTSPFHQRRRSSAAYEYLHEIDKLHQLPKPMGIAKWRGPPTELNLQYCFDNAENAVVHTRWATLSPRR